MSKIVVTPGDEVFLSGKNFRPSMTVAASGLTDGGSPKVTVMSDSKASLLVPISAGFGLMDVTLTQDGMTQKGTLLSNGGKTDYPIFSSGTEQICRGMKFYDISGTLQEGIRDCGSGLPGLPTCETNGQVGCVTTNDVPALVKASLNPAHFKTSIDIVGVQGTLPACTLDGQTDCLAVPLFKATDMSRAVPSNIKAGVTMAGVVGTYPSAASPLSANSVAADLSSIGPSTPVGIYEFFDSTGAVHSLVVADGGTITPSSTSQTLGLDGTFYRGLTISGTSVSGSSNCVQNGDQNCYVTGSFYAGSQCADGDANCFLRAYNAQSQPLKAVNFAGLDSGRGQIRSSLTISGVVGTLDDCTADQVSGCVTTDTYKSANLKSLAAGNIKNGVILAGVVGTYPSSAARLAGNSDTADLSTFGPNTPVGAYEFFDSSGNVYSATVADGGTVVPGTSDQPVNAVGTMYRAFTVAGDSDLTAAHIRSSTTLFGVVGTVNQESHNDCNTDGSIGCVAVNAYQAVDMTKLLAGNIKNAITIAGVVGTYPSATHPLEGATGTADPTAPRTDLLAA
jgi:hypothetical protein